MEKKEIKKYDYELMEKEIKKLIEDNNGVIPTFRNIRGKSENIPKDNLTINKHYIKKYGVTCIDYYTAKGYKQSTWKGNAKYTIEDMKKLANDLGFELLNDTYTNSEEKCKLKCLKCEEIKEVKYYALQRGKVKCKKCGVNPRRFTYEQVKNYIEMESNSGCKLLETEESYLLKCKEQPKASMRKLELKCACGRNFEVSLNAFKSDSKQKCNECTFEETGRRYRHKYEDVKKFIEVESESGCKLLSEEYIDNHKPLHIKCSCGNDFYRALAEFKGRKLYRCHICTGASVKPTFDMVKRDLLSHGIELFEVEYINQNTKMKIKYPCGFEVARDYANIRKSNYKCPHCIKPGYGRDTMRLKEEIKSITNNEYELLSEYKTMNDKVLIKHKKCGYEYEITPHNFLDAGNRCPKCNFSKGEIKVEEYLKENKYTYIPQYSFSDLLSVKGAELKFDFAVFEDNELLTLIEYDGEFHFKKLYEEHDFEGQKLRDYQKNEYCRFHNINLIRIPYWEFESVDKILEKEITNIRRNVNGKKNK